MTVDMHCRCRLLQIQCEQQALLLTNTGKVHASELEAVHITGTTMSLPVTQSGH